MTELVTRSALLAALIGVGRAAEGNKNRPDLQTHQALLSGITMLPYADTDSVTIQSQVFLLHDEKYRLATRCLTCKKQCGRNDDYDLVDFKTNSGQVSVLKFALLALIQVIATILNQQPITSESSDAFAFLYDALYWLGKGASMQELFAQLENGGVVMQTLLNY